MSLHENDLCREDALQAMWENEDKTLNAAIEWALCEDENLRDQCIAFACTNSKIKRELELAVERKMEELAGYDPRMEPEYTQDR